jgi:hypothetical protein
MTIDNVLHTLWTNSISNGDKLSKRDEKRLWMLLQRFIDQKDGRREAASSYDVGSPSEKPLSQIGRSKTKPTVISKACNRVRALLRFQA